MDLEENDCGYVLPLNNPSGFEKAINHLAGTKKKGKFKDIKINAVEYARKKYWKSVNGSGYEKIFC